MADLAAVTTGILADAFNRVHDGLPSQLEGLSAEELLWRPGPDANPIAWIAWHIGRVQDDFLAGIGGVDQVWTQGWSQRFGLPYDERSIGYGHTSEEVGQFAVTDVALLTGYQTAVQEMTLQVLATLRTPEDYERVLDERTDPPMTVAVRLSTVINGITQHLGQAGYLRGLLEQRRAAGAQ